MQWLLLGGKRSKSSIKIDTARVGYVCLSFAFIDLSFFFNVQ